MRALDTSPGNLRPATTSLIGRESEVAEIRRRCKAHRLVTLTGVGGVGKTRLALEVAARLADEFPDGVWVFELAAVTDPAAVPDAVAAVLGITQQPGKTVSESVAAALEGRVRLLVIDNCEHVLDAAADLIEAILAHSATVRILATSREGLGVPDEQVWPVRSLDAAAGIDSAAVSLFVERAQGIASGFSMVDGDEAAAVTEICQRLDGIPLAIELAASRMASMTASEMRDRLDHRFRLLVGSRRGLERHHTLRHAVAWSYDLLDDTEKTVLDRCSVFAGGFDLQSACAVAGSDDLDEYAILEVLDALVRKSLLIADRSQGGPGFRCWRRSASSPRNNSSPAAKHPRFGPPTRATSPDAKPTSWPCGTAPASGMPTTGSPSNWPICAPRFGGPPTRATSMSPPPSPLTRRSSAVGRQLRADRLGRRADRARPRRRPSPARVPVRDGGTVLESRTDRGGCRLQRRRPDGDRQWPPRGAVRPRAVLDSLPGHRPARTMRRVVSRPARTRSRHPHIRQGMPGIALTFAGCGEEARAAANGLIEAAEATHNPLCSRLRFRPTAIAFRDADPAGALDALRRGLVIAQDSGNRYTETHPGGQSVPPRGRTRRPVGRARSRHAAIRNFHDAGNTTRSGPLAILAAFFDRLGRYEPAATIAGFAVSPIPQRLPRVNTAIAHLRDILGDPTYESLARKGETMTTAAMATYAYDQIDQARTELERLADSVDDTRDRG